MAVETTHGTITQKEVIFTQIKSFFLLNRICKIFVNAIQFVTARDEEVLLYFLFTDRVSFS